MTKNHREKSIDNLNCWVITVSDTRTEEEDSSGAFVKGALEDRGYIVSKYEIIKDEASQIERILKRAKDSNHVQVLIFNGGTGISSRDVTYNTLIDTFDQEMVGFGELFRYLSYKEIGAYAQLSNACAGYLGSKLIYSLPGSEGAVKLAMRKLILPVIGHAVYELTKD